MTAIDEVLEEFAAKAVHTTAWADQLMAKPSWFDLMELAEHIRALEEKIESLCDPR